MGVLGPFEPDRDPTFGGQKAIYQKDLCYTDGTDRPSSGACFGPKNSSISHHFNPSANVTLFELISDPDFGPKSGRKRVKKGSNRPKRPFTRRICPQKGPKRPQMTTLGPNRGQIWGSEMTPKTAQKSITSILLPTLHLLS